jgi:broad specificity phosphatase PhoE
VDVSRRGNGATGTRTETVPIYLVRHAKASSRKRWTRPDDQRPLTRAGREQAAALVRLLAGRPLARLVSSPYVRCMQTLEPLAEERGLPLATSDSLAEGAPPDGALALAVESAQHGPTALCTHGDVIELLLEELASHDVPLGTQDGIELRKGSTWILDVLDGDVVAAEYVPPPAVGNER